MSNSNWEYEWKVIVGLILASILIPAFPWLRKPIIISGIAAAVTMLIFKRLPKSENTNEVLTKLLESKSKVEETEDLLREHREKMKNDKLERRY